MENSPPISQEECADMEIIPDINSTSPEDTGKSIDNLAEITLEHAYSGVEDPNISDSQEESPDESPKSPILEENMEETMEDDENEDTIEPRFEPTPEKTPEPESEPVSDKANPVIKVEPVSNKTNQVTKVEPVQEKVKSRELKSLLEAAKESNLDTNIAHKRESRKSTDPFGSKESRTMRSQNPETTTKHPKIVHKVGKSDVINDGNDQDDETQSHRKDKDGNIAIPKTPKRKKDNFADSPLGVSTTDESKKNRKALKLDVLNQILNTNMKEDKDSYCWRCHREGILVQCETCPRAFHTRCLKQPVHNPDRWPCPECLGILQAESTKTRSPAMRDMSLAHLCELLKYAVKRMIDCAGSEPFIHPVDEKLFPDYRQYIVQPMDLTTIQNNIRNNLYGSTVAFMADAKWILHNSIIYNSYQSKLTTAAKLIFKICKQEMSEIETCSECYLNANTKKNSWFIEVCSKPHILLWAKLKGFPYWPAKAMTTNAAGLVDVRFFGAHDRAWIPVRECFLYSKKDPNTTNKSKRNNIQECIKEVDIHIEKIKEIFGEFVYAPYRTPYDPATEVEQLTFMIPKYKTAVKYTITKIPQTPGKVKIEKTENGEDDKPLQTFIKKRGRPTSRTSSVNEEQEIKRSRSSISRSVSRAPSDNEDNEMGTSTSVTSEKNEKPENSMNFSTDEFDRFMEGYGTEDDDSLQINTEVRKKISRLRYESDSEEETEANTSASYDEEMKNGTEGHTQEEEEDEDDDDDDDDDDEEQSDMLDTSLTRGKVRTRGGYHNVSGKVKIIKRVSGETPRKRRATSPNQSETPQKISRRNSDISTKSDSSRISGISEKISKVEEFSDNLEVNLANTSATVSFSQNTTPEKKRLEFLASDKADLGKLKPVIQVSTGDLYNKNKEFRISPQNKSVSIADRLIKKITEAETSPTPEVDSVKKQILDSLEAGSSTKMSDVKHDKEEKNENVTSTGNSDKEEKAEKVNEVKEAEEKAEENEESSDEEELSETKSLEVVSEKLQSVSSSSEPSTDKPSNEIVVEGEKDKERTKEGKQSADTSKFVAIVKIAGNVNKDKQSITDNKVKPAEKDAESSENETISKVSILEAMEADSDEEEEEETSEEEESETEQPTTVIKPQNSVKLVNVSDIISGKIDDKKSQATFSLKVKPKEKEVDTTKEQENDTVVEIKSEPESEGETEKDQEVDKPLYDVTLTVVDKKIASVVDKEKPPFKIIDNMTRVIDSVASNFSKISDNNKPSVGGEANKTLTINRKEITLRPISKLMQQSPKQKARKTFPNSPNSTPTRIQPAPVHIKKVTEKRDNINPPRSSTVALKVVSTLHTVTANMTTPTTSVSKDSMVYLSPQTTSVINSMGLPPNQPITLTQNVGSPILAMVQHHGMNTPSLIIQQNPSIPITTQAQLTTPSTSQYAIVTPTAENQPLPLPPLINSAITLSTQSTSNALPEENGITDTIAKAVGDMLTKPPPKLKPRPPGPMSTFFDDGAPSTAGPATKMINSVAHRLTDYFRGLMRETLHDLATLGNPESKIRSLELDIETLKHKHAEEMLELRKNISSILKDIQKSLVEEKAKIADETRAACEAECIRRIDEAKAKQWCAFCLKEAQFYCCWNTSYCDYPCQQKHWASHMKTCAQSAQRTLPIMSSSSSSSGDKMITTSTANQINKLVPKHTYSNCNKTVLKQTRMIVKQTNKGMPMYIPIQRPLQPGQQTITLVESTPGNFEIVGNHGAISLGGKLVPSTTIKVKPGNVIVASSSANTTTTSGVSNTQKAIVLSQKAPVMGKLVPASNNKEQSAENKT